MVYFWLFFIIASLSIIRWHKLILLKFMNIDYRKSPQYTKSIITIGVMGLILGLWFFLASILK